MCYNKASREIVYAEIEDTGYRRWNGVARTLPSLQTDLARPPHRHIDLTTLCDKFNVT
jgi:hypothetical protein